MLKWDQSRHLSAAAVVAVESTEYMNRQLLSFRFSCSFLLPEQLAGTELKLRTC